MVNIKHLILMLMAAFLLSSCERVEEPKAKLASAEKAAQDAFASIESTTYAQNGIEFEYPANWEVIDEGERDEMRYIMLESPDQALSLIHVYKKDGAPTLEDFANNYSIETQIIPLDVAESESNEAPVAAAPQNEMMTIERTLDDKSYEWVVETIPGQVGGIETTDYREYFRKDSETQSAFLINQVNKDDLPRLENTFELIFRSLTPL